MKILHLPWLELPCYLANAVAASNELGELQDQVDPNVVLPTPKPQRVICENAADPTLLKGRSTLCRLPDHWLNICVRAVDELHCILRMRAVSELQWMRAAV